RRAPGRVGYDRRDVRGADVGPARAPPQAAGDPRCRRLLRADPGVPPESVRPALPPPAGQRGTERCDRCRRDACVPAERLTEGRGSRRRRLRARRREWSGRVMKIVPDHAAGHDRETATSHYFDEEPSTPSRPHVVTLELPDLKLEIVTDAGVFGAQKQKVDPGTRTLLMLAPDPPPEGEIMDLGCGYGPIALALGKRAPRARIWAVDVNQRALELTGQN